MQTFQLQNIFGTTGSGAQLTPFGSPSSLEIQGFENILQGMLSTTQQTHPLAQALAAGLENMNLHHDNAIAALTAILDKITEAVDQGMQSFSIMQQEVLINDTLSDEEISFLQNLIQYADGETGGENSTVDPAGMLAALFEGNSEKPASQPQSILQELEQIIQSLTTLLEKSGYTTEMPTDIHQGLTRDRVPDETVQTERPDGRLPLLVTLRDTLQQVRTQYLSMIEQVSRQEPVVLKAAHDTGLSLSIAEKAPLLSEIIIPDSNIALENGKNFLGGVEEIIRRKLNLPKPVVTDTVLETEKPAALTTILKDAGSDTQQQKPSFSFDKQSYTAQHVQNTKQQAIPIPGNPGKKFAIEQLLSSTLQTNNQIENSDNTVQAPPVSNSKLFEQVILSDSQPDRPAQPVLFNQHNQQETILFDGITARVNAAEYIEPAGNITVKEPVHPAQVIDQITERINVGMQRGESKITLQIHPPHLGKLEIDLSMRDNQLRAIIIAESHQARQLIEGNLDQLKTCLESQNIDVDKVTVFVGQENRQFASHLRDQHGRYKKAVPKTEDGTQTKEEEHTGMVAGLNPLHYTGSGYGVDLFV